MQKDIEKDGEKKSEMGRNKDKINKQDNIEDGEGCMLAG